MLRSSPPPRLSAKKHQALKGKKVYSTITAKPKPIRKVNPVASAKRNARRKQSHAKYRASETFKIVTERAAGRCEASLRYMRQGRELVLVEISDGMEWMANGAWVRCTETDDLEHHHVRYPDEPGGEVPEDMCVVGQRCHGWIERVNHPTRRGGR